jgi:hypothetical protein
MLEPSIHNSGIYHWRRLCPPQETRTRTAPSLCIPALPCLQSHITTMTMLHLFQLFSLTSFQEISNEAFLTSTSLLLGLPVPHDRYLQATQPLNANSDIWADTLLNKSAHAVETRKTTHTQFAQQLTRMANECGISTTSTSARIPCTGRNEGQRQRSRKMRGHDDLDRL